MQWVACMLKCCSYVGAAPRDSCPVPDVAQRVWLCGCVVQMNELDLLMAQCSEEAIQQDLLPLLVKCMQIPVSLTSFGTQASDQPSPTRFLFSGRSLSKHSTCDFLLL